MSKGKFEPGKRVLLISDGRTKLSVWAEKHVRTEAVLEALAYAHSAQYRTSCWFLVGIGHDAEPSRGAWRQSCMILIDPDETPEQSAEAMRNLYSLPQKVTA